MCIEQNADDFATIHHELGHNFYQRAYNKQPPLFQNSANDGFHEAIGDTIALSVTPEYLKKIGIIDSVPPPSEDIGLLLNKALDKVAFLPFGLMVDEWRWKVYSGEIRPADYNKSWWELRRKYQGIAPPIPRSEADFDAAAKYHVPANVPYARYFSGLYPGISISPRAVQGSWHHRTAGPLFDLRKQGRGREARENAGDGCESLVARCPGSVDG